MALQFLSLLVHITDAFREVKPTPPQTERLNLGEFVEAQRCVVITEYYDLGAAKGAGFSLQLSPMYAMMDGDGTLTGLLRWHSNKGRRPGRNAHATLHHYRRREASSSRASVAV